MSLLAHAKSFNIVDISASLLAGRFGADGRVASIVYVASLPDHQVGRDVGSALGG